MPSPLRRQSGITLLEVTLLILFLGFVVAFLMPVRTGRPRSTLMQCSSSLKSTALALQLFAVDNSDRFPWAVPVQDGGILGAPEPWTAAQAFQTLRGQLPSLSYLVCPADRRDAAVNFQSLAASNVSYFLNVDAAMTFTNCPLAGDRNLELAGRAAGPGLLLFSTNQPLAWGKGMHDRKGNLALVDGSVVQTRGQITVAQFGPLAPVTNRFLLP